MSTGKSPEKGDSKPVRDKLPKAAGAALVLVRLLQAAHYALQLWQMIHG